MNNDDQLALKTKQISDRELKSLAKRASLDILASISKYSTVISRIENMAQGFDVRHEKELNLPIVSLKANETLLNQYNSLMNFETKYKDAKDDDFSNISDDELDLLIKKSEPDNSLDAEIEEEQYDS